MSSKKLTIGLFIDTYFPMTDGVIMVVDNYARRLIKYANVIVFAPRLLGKEIDDTKFPYKIVRCRSLKVPFIDYSLPMPKMDYGFKKILNTYKLDIVHIHSPFSVGKAGIKYAKSHNVPVIGTMHSQYKQDIMRAVRNKKVANTLTKKLIDVFNKCDECWAVNSEVARIFYEDYGYKCLPKVMNNATEMLPVKNYSKACKLVNDKYHLNDVKVFTFVGRINALKGVFFILDSLYELKKINPKFKFKMLFIGNGQDMEELKKKIKEYKLDNDVILCGKITDRDLLASIYARSDLFLFPSMYDASSIVQIEAASQKTPGLFLEGSATSSTVTNNQNGYIEKKDPTLYAKRILNIFDNQESHKKVSQNAYRDLYKNWDNVVNDIYEKYLELIKINE